MTKKLTPKVFNQVASISEKSRVSNVRIDLLVEQCVSSLESMAIKTVGESFKVINHSVNIVKLSDDWLETYVTVMATWAGYVIEEVN